MKKSHILIILLAVLILFSTSVKKTGDVSIPGFCKQESPSSDQDCGIPTGYYEEDFGTGNAKDYPTYLFPEGKDSFWVYTVPDCLLNSKMYFNARMGGSYSDYVVDVPQSCYDYNPGVLRYRANFYWDTNGGTSHNDWIRIYCQTGPDNWHFLVGHETHGYAPGDNIFVDEDMHWQFNSLSFEEFGFMKNFYLGGLAMDQFVTDANNWARC